MYCIDAIAFSTLAIIVFLCRCHVAKRRILVHVFGHQIVGGTVMQSIQLK
jgi:hypothetical protein